ncbi:major facilitator superfamily domain-containing protein [Fennellomyces sp. T-0311]|nr:major facilitator superfamily domain-containing protein [Fennellomyces sp. T-0311]
MLVTIQSFLMQSLTGINDGNLGIILPSIKSHYNLSEYIVSIIFLCNACGYMTAAILNGYLIKYFSQSKTVLIGACSMIVGYLVNLFAVPFPVMCVFMTSIGFGISLVQAAANVVCGEMPYSMLMLSFLHAFYGAGALVGPFMASGILNSQMPWNMTYAILCGLACFNAISIFICFRKLRTSSEKEIDAERERIIRKKNLSSCTTIYRITSLGAVFLLFYTGNENTIGNWTYTYLITERSTDTVAMTHILSGYWAGICAGRLFLGFVTLRFGEKRTVYCYLIVILAMMILLWLFPNIGANATSLALIGFTLGPIFPIIISMARQIVPVNLYATSVGFLSAFASAGTALFPYITGVLVGSHGIDSMMPFCVATFSAMLIMWVFIPDPRPPSKLSAKLNTWATKARRSTDKQ